ncbi:conserved Plasmodium protein, unknown function [Plasmodium knowlesi strain H]|uniref:HVA22-like protein n=3 Tax=Plasmodium knowlesi TaxID=5850 RepID=A0A5K1UVI8_PLAKH|nr:conserved protein, unknown function [Plasmodium knowlesi strain H]OTN65116.1 Uncharacterized protein PKNOH_S120133800 [Plasmodium knowlesi]CAA9988197.1 conserved protein, unknown function [Plasmodium knowlesi strain H]SBO20116.1 conserved Plasmodium protein, unknown function [Plasmodium knowlesi strain H]SBO20642.1 conserved Plasmodium protein, unknown function [Plasmodium knowlesi strain H]VVS77671.1 conserved protein, unknown function [Plasmodium knowlesi strain H]|eukprot:XP_002259174.1 hypothetical protein, conserved in Plasmodium species [Plasmodium knowlesi strain H]
MFGALFKLIIFVVGYLLPVGLSFHGWKNKKYEMVEYYLKYVYFFVVFENIVTPSIGALIYKISSFIWCLIHLSLYVVLIIPKFNYLNVIYEKVSKVNSQNNVTLYINNYIVNPLNDKVNKIVKKLKTL